MLKRIFTFSILLAFFVGNNAFSQVEGTLDVNPNLLPEKIQPNYPITEATWDVQFNYDATTITGAAGNAGAVFIPTINKYWTSRWGTGIIHQWNIDGTLDQTYTLTFTGTRGMCFDGQFVYHSTSTTTVQIVDPTTRTVVGTIPVTGAPNGFRFITFNPDGDGGNGSIIGGNWTSPNLNFYEFSMTGTLLRTITNAVTGVYGMAYDKWSPGGPFLWVWGQGSGAGFPQIIQQMDYTTGLYTGVQHDATTDVGLGNASAIAGGLFIAQDIIPGFVTLGGLLQGTPDVLFGYELTTSGSLPCPVGPATNPSPASGTTGVSITAPGNATWTNGANTTQVEVFFGAVGNVVSVYSGAPTTSYTIPTPLQYATTYQWRVVCKNDTCSGTPVANWNFTTMQNPLLVQDTITVHPQSFDYWTGTTDGVTKTEVSIVNGQNTLDGWMKFDLTGIPAGSNITGVTFNGYVSGTNWPYWSLTPMALDPVTGTAANIYAAIQAGNALGTAYLYSNEASTYTTGAKTYPLVEGNILSDMTAAVSNGYFAMGMASRDNSATYFITFDGWAQTNPPSLDVIYEYVVPVELTSFAATTDNKNVNLNWTTATELNNSGFQIERSSGSEYQVVGFVAGHGTTTEVQNYSIRDQNVNAGTYTYRLKQVDFDGTFEYSNAIEVDSFRSKRICIRSKLSKSIQSKYKNKL